MFEDTWYLTELIVDGNNIEIPSNSDFVYVILDFIESPTMGINTQVCNLIGASVTQFTDTFFETDGFALLTFNCFEQGTFDFEDIYFNGFYEDSTPLSRFTYTLDSASGDGLMLTIINMEGDTAIYGNPALGVQEPSSDIFSLYPNPVKGVLFLQVSQSTKISEVRVFDVQGRLINQKEPTQTPLIEIDTTSLEAGLYFVHVIDTIGNVEVQQFVKK